MDSTTRLAIVFGLLAGIGATLLLSQLRYFRQISLTDRIQPFSGARSIASVSASIVDILMPSISTAGERIASLLGVNDDLATRLTRAGLGIDTQSFRMRQIGAAGAGLAIGIIALVVIRPPLLLLPLFVLTPPLLGFLLLEQSVVTKAQSRQRRIFVELPVMSEQLAMLLSAGYSVGAALARIAERNTGSTGRDLKRVCDRIRHGLTTSQALNEWAAEVSVPELNRLVKVLSLSSETSDLGSLVSAEAKAIRRESQRRLNETMEKRGQQVWVPVTVATLVPGVIFLIIPFLQALNLFSGN